MVAGRAANDRRHRPTAAPPPTTTTEIEYAVLPEMRAVSESHARTARPRSPARITLSDNGIVVAEVRLVPPNPATPAPSAAICSGSLYRFRPLRPSQKRFV